MILKTNKWEARNIGFPFIFKQCSATLLICILILLVGCATRYHAWDGKEGYFETEVDQRRHVTVTFMGNHKSAGNRMVIHALYRAAELTLEKGFDYFDILSLTTGTIPDFIMNRDCSGHMTFQDTPRPVAEVKIHLYRANQPEIPSQAFMASQFRQDYRKFLNNNSFNVEEFLAPLNLPQNDCQQPVTNK